MGVTFTSVKCPECGASLPIEEGRTQVFCSYCGTRVLVTNENEHIYRHIDEAGIKQAETDRLVKLKQMEIAEKKTAAAERTKTLKVKISLILAAVGIIMMVAGNMLGHSSGDSDSGYYMMSTVGFFPLMGAVYIWLLSKDKDDDDDFGDKVKVPSGISGYEKKSYVAIEAMFRGAGFTNVNCIPLNDLTFGLLKKPNVVESITIDGKEITSGGKKFAPDAKVVISYHSVASR